MKTALVDTNLVLRMLVDGSDRLPQLAMKSKVWLTNEVIFEVVYVLASFYKQPRDVIFKWIVDLVMKPNVVSERVLVVDTLLTYRDHKNLSLIDSYLLNLAKKEKVELVSEDKDLVKLI